MTLQIWFGSLRLKDEHFNDQNALDERIKWLESTFHPAFIRYKIEA